MQDATKSEQVEQLDLVEELLEVLGTRAQSVPDRQMLQLQQRFETLFRDRPLSAQFGETFLERLVGSAQIFEASSQSADVGRQRTHCIAIAALYQVSLALVRQNLVQARARSQLRQVLRT